MKIGVIADTHTAVSVANHALEYLKSRHCDLIIHAGDIVELATLKILKRLRVPYVAVIGNNDTALLKYKNDFNLFFQPHIFEFGGLKFKLMHHPFFSMRRAISLFTGIRTILPRQKLAKRYF